MKRAATLPMLKDRVILRTLYGAISFSGTIVELLGGEIDGVDTSDLGISCEFGWNERNDEKIRDNTNKCKNINENMSEEYIYSGFILNSKRTYIMYVAWWLYVPG